MLESELPEVSQETVVREKMRQVQSQFGAVAAAYVTSKVHASGYDLDWLVETAALTGSEQVLDVATGGGHTAFALAPHAVQVVALDLTRAMLNVAQREAETRGLHNISYLEGDAQALPCADESFDVVTCRHAPHHFPNAPQAVREWGRVLKSGGKLLLVDSTSPEEPEAEALLHEIELLRDPSHVRNRRISTWTALLDNAGFTVREAREWSLALDIPSWTRRMRTPPATVATIEQLMRTAAPAVRARLGISEQNSVLSFMLPVALIFATK